MTHQEEDLILTTFRLTTVRLFTRQRIQHRAGDGGAVLEDKAIHRVPHDRARSLLPFCVTVDFHGETGTSCRDLVLWYSMRLPNHYSSIFRLKHPLMLTSVTVRGGLFGGWPAIVQ